MTRTPGPWRIHGRVATLVVGDEGRYVCTTGAYSTNQYDLTDPERVERENSANARLIAAAPELYDALWLLARQQTKENIDRALLALASVEEEAP